MIVLPPELFVDALGFSKAERIKSVISNSDKAKLITELESAGLSSATLAQKLDYLNSPKEYTTVVNTTMYGTPESMAALAGLVQDRMMALPTDDPKKANAVLLSDMAYKRSQLLSSEKRNADRDADATQGLKSMALALGLLTEEEFTSHFTIRPDNYQAVVWETPASRVLAENGVSVRIIVQIEDLV